VARAVSTGAPPPSSPPPAPPLPLPRSPLNVSPQTQGLKRQLTSQLKTT
jgi:hypothetical protein